MTGLVALALAASAAAPPALERRVLRATLDLPAPVERVWEAWTTEAGARSFFAPDCRIELRVDGAYEMYFDPKGPEGLRGGDGMRILALDPPRRIAFTWNAPPSIPEIRAQRTLVEVELQDAGTGRTRLTFVHSGWGRGPEWDRAYDYFDGAWAGQVLPFLVRRFTHGPIDWSARPEVAPLRPSLKATLAEVPRP